MFTKIRMLIIIIGTLVITPLLHLQEVPYGVGDWDEDQYGNHRVVIHLSAGAIGEDAVWVHIPWRRRDLHPEEKAVILIDARTGQRILNLQRIEINREFGDLVFQSKSGSGDYFLYYLPNIMTGRSNYPTVIYPEPQQTADPGWLEEHGFTPSGLPAVKAEDFPQAEVLEIQAIDPLNSFYPMEVIATADEVQGLLERYPDASYLIFPEDRYNPIRMPEDLPLKWIKTRPLEVFEGTAARGEFYAYQIGLFACRAEIPDIELQFGDLRNIQTGDAIPATASTCFNTGGIDWTGKPFDKACPVGERKVQALWCGVQVPEDIDPGEYTGEITINPEGLDSGHLRIVLRVTDEILEDSGDSDPWKHSRLRWLDSTIALDDGIVPPFSPLQVDGNRVKCLGREVILDQSGLPLQILSFFTPGVTRIGENGRDILAAPVEFIIQDSEKGNVRWIEKGTEILKTSPGAVSWRSINTSGPLVITCLGQMEFDGYVECDIELTSTEDIKINDIRLEIPIRRDVAKYMMGMGYRGGLRPRGFNWKWDSKKNQDSAWVGDVNAGLQCSFRDENYSRPLNTNFYQLKPLILPRSWWNQGWGGCDFLEVGEDIFLIKAYSGPRRIRKGEELHYVFSLLITPFKTLDTKAQWNTRYYHQFRPVEEIAETGANTINIHHANAINPYINYPFLRPLEMKQYIDRAHERGMKVKIYYTVRELTNRAPEIFALRSLGEEIFAPGPGGGFSWLQEHLVSNYINGWFVPKLKDAAIVNSGVSRWHNYYLEGLKWLVENVGIDGLYIDDVAFDRTVMKRLRKILDRNRQGALIDLHSANQYNPRDGFANSANLYLEHFPYINRLWFGEYFDYDSQPDFWLVEVSGIPFGLMGEMLQDGGNPWRGMLYGMTARLPWSGNPAPLWKFWDEFGMDETEMIGYWVPDCPVKTDSPEILATVYRKQHEVLISVASWAVEKTACQLSIDWEILGLDRRKARLTAPAIQDFQDSALFTPDQPLPVEPGRGWLLVLNEK
jgi:hypothetical protein